VHDDSQIKSSAFIDVVLPLPLINSVLFNALLQLFGRAEEERKRSESGVQASVDIPLQILVVEDNSTNQIIAQEILQRQGWTVHLAANGKLGYELFLALEEVLDIVLMDLHMDVMDGYESSTLIRSKNENIPIIVTSADLMETVRRRCKEIGVTDLIGKPYDPDQLISKVAELALPYHQRRKSIDFERGVFSVGGDKNLYLRVLGAFISELEQLLPSLRKALVQQDFHAGAELAHKAKGSCGTIGALQAQKLCANLQQSLENETCHLKRRWIWCSSCLLRCFGKRRSM
jgi:CheY-like chemotaxis protein